MKKILFFILLFTFSIAAEKHVFTTNEHVKVELQTPSKIGVTKSGSFKFFFTPIEGIHINTEPMFELKLDKDSQFEIAGEPRFSKNDKNYLVTAKPIEFSIKLKDGLQPGTYPLKGKLFYFYCSDKDGWCNRFAQPIDLTITVTK